MVRIGVRELNQHTSKYIAMVKDGETVEVTERGQLGARLVAAPRTGTILDELVAARLADPLLRSLDAIHLATALEFGSELHTFVAYDKRLLAAASAAGLTTTRPTTTSG